MKKSYTLIGKRGYMPMKAKYISSFLIIFTGIFVLCFLRLAIYVSNNYSQEYQLGGNSWTYLVVSVALAYGLQESIRMKYLFFERHTRKRIKVDELNLRLCEPPYKGNSEQDLANYLQNNVYGDYEFYNEMSNQIVYGQDELYDLVFSKKRDEIVFAESPDFENASKTIFEIPSEIIYTNNKFSFFGETGKLKGKWKMQISVSELKELLK